MPSFSKPSTATSESSPVRPEQAAFRELDALVRNLGDQLAGYRRRALAAELRARELEGAADVARSQVGMAQERAERTGDELAAMSQMLSGERLANARLQGIVEDLTKTVTDIKARSAKGTGVPSANEQAVIAENEELRRRIDQASARTRELNERLRFLRQQLATVPEK